MPVSMLLFFWYGKVVEPLLGVQSAWIVVGIQLAVEAKTQPMMKIIKAVEPRPQPKHITNLGFLHYVTRTPITPVAIVRIAQMTRTEEATLLTIEPGVTVLALPVVMAVILFMTNTAIKIAIPQTKSNEERPQRIPRFFF
jgi:hypothetical protein